MICYLDEDISFPHPDVVTSSGVLAVYGDLSLNRLLLAYNYGIFPWYNEDEPIIWWCPSPRYVIFPNKVLVSKSMNSYFNQEKFKVTYNQNFLEVIRSCQLAPRKNQPGTWIDEDIIKAYYQFHLAGYAESVEVWEGDQLVGGLYGINIGKVFFGESMFSLKSNASKFGFISLARKLESEGYAVIDCQLPNPHLTTLGGEFISGVEFNDILSANRKLYLSNDVETRLL